MASPTQLIQFTFAAGIDQSQRHEVLDPSAGFLLRQNLRQKDRGSVGRRDALTYQTIARLDATSRSAGYKMFAHGADGKQTCVIDGSVIDVYSNAASVNVSRGRLPECALSVHAAHAPGAVPSAVHDAIDVGSYIATVWMVGTAEVWAAVEDAATGTVVVAPSLVTTAGSNACVGLGSYGSQVLLFVVSSSANIPMYGIDTSSTVALNAGWSSLGNVATDHNGGGNLALSVQNLSDRVAIAYINSGGTPTDRVTVRTCNASGSLQSATVNTNSVAGNQVAVEGSSSDTLWVAWDENLNVRLKGLNPTTLSTTLASTATILTVNTSARSIGIVSSATAGKGRLLVGEGGSPSDRMQMRNFQTSAGAAATDGAQTTVYAATPLSRPVRIGSRYYAMFGDKEAITGGTPQQVAILCDFTEDVSYLRPVANVFPSLVSVPGTDTSSWRAHIFSSQGKYWVPVNVIRSGNATATYFAQFDFASTQRWQPAQRSGATILSGGVVSQFDGLRVAEAAFLLAPVKPTTSLAASGYTSTNAKYVATYEEVDAAGNWHVSGISLPSAGVSPANQVVTVATTPLTITGRQVATSNNRTRVVFWRTPTGGSPPYYRVGEASNNTGAATVTLADTMADTTLTTKAKLYAPSLAGINGSAQDRRAPPGLNFLLSYNGMIVGALGEDVWFSGQEVSGEGIWFNPAFQFPVSGDGEITGLAAEDGTLYVFKRRAIYAVSGDAPSDNGAAGGFGTPRRLATDVGCVDARSLVVTEKGIFFQSERGIELLSRAQSVQWIGEAVKTSLGSYAVQAATLDSKASRVYFELSNATALVYDLGREQWDSVDMRDVSAARSACMIWDGSAYRYAYLQSDGYVRVSWDNGYDHSAAANTWPVMRVTTGWPKLSGIQGQHIMNRVLLLAKKTTSAATSIALAYDYDESFETATAYTSATTDTLSTNLARIQLGHDVHDDGEGQAIRVDLQDGAPGGAVDTVGGSLGHTWIALTFEGQPRPNAAPLPETAS